MEPAESTSVAVPGPALPSVAHANPGRRLASGIIDVVVVAVAGVAYTLALGTEQQIDGGLQMTINDKTVTGGLAWLFVASALLYFMMAELASGRTLGKAFTGLRVQMADGSPLRPGPVVVRNLFRIVDGIPYVVPNLLGFIVVASTEKNQRVGDLVAKTVVVRA